MTCGQRLPSWWLCCPQGLKKYDRDVAVALLTAMYEDDADFTNTFRALSGVSTSGTDDLPVSLSEVWSLQTSWTHRHRWSLIWTLQLSLLHSGMNEPDTATSWPVTFRILGARHPARTRQSLHDAAFCRSPMATHWRVAHFSRVRSAVRCSAGAR